MTFLTSRLCSPLLLTGLLLCGSAIAATAPPTAPAASTSQLSSRLDQIIQSGVLRVGTTGDYKPFSYKIADKFIGFDIELAEGLAHSLGVKLELVPTSWPTLMNDLHADRFDLGISGVSANLERQKTAFFSQPYQRDGKTPITLCAKEQAFQTLEQIDRPEVRVIVNPGGTNEVFVRANIKQAQIVMHPENVTIFQQIVDGNVDLMITDAIETRVQEKIHPELCAVHPDKPFNFSEKAVLMSRDIVLKQYVDQWLRQDQESGEMGKRMDKWLAYPWEAPRN